MRTQDNTRWFEPGTDDDDASSRLVAWARRVDHATVDRQQQVLSSYALYGSTAMLLAGGVTRALPASNRLGVNRIASAVDTLVADVTQHETIPTVGTAGASWEEQQRARKLDGHISLQFTDEGALDAERLAARDAAIAGLGCARAYPDDKRVQYERIHPLSILVDDRACVDVSPRDIALRRAMPRQYAMALWPEHADAIDSAPRPSSSYWSGMDATVDAVEVLEAWHLPSGSKAEDGRHVIAIESVPALVNEDYDQREFPLAFITAVPGARGFWGESLVQRAAPAQLELNKLLRRVQEAMHLVSVPRIFVQQGSVCKAHMTNDVGIVVDHQGPPPVFMSPPAMGADVYQQIDRLSGWVFEAIGVSAMAAVSEKPVGLNSGRALRNFHDFQSKRYVNFERSIERASVKLAQDTIALNRKIAEESDGHSVVLRNGDTVGREDWAKIDLDDEKVRIRIMPSSALPRSVSGRIEELQEMAGAGLIDQRTFIRAANLVDLESMRDEITAPEDSIRRKLEAILDGKAREDYTPEPYEDLALARRLCVLAIQKAEIAGAPDTRVDGLRQWLAEVDALQQRMAPPAPMPGPELGMPPGMPPMDSMMPVGPGFPGAEPPMPPMPIPGPEQLPLGPTGSFPPM